MEIGTAHSTMHLQYSPQERCTFSQAYNEEHTAHLNQTRITPNHSTNQFDIQTNFVPTNDERRHREMAAGKCFRYQLATLLVVCF